MSVRKLNTQDPRQSVLANKACMCSGYRVCYSMKDFVVILILVLRQ